MISSEMTFYFELKYSLRCFREESISLINCHYHFPFRKWNHHFRERSGCWYTSSTAQLTSFSFLQSHLVLFTLRIQIHRCVIICSSREIDESVNTLKPYPVSSHKTVFPVSPDDFKSWSIQYQSFLTHKECTALLPRARWFSPVTWKSKHKMSGSKILDADELCTFILSMRSMW